MEWWEVIGLVVVVVVGVIVRNFILRINIGGGMIVGRGDRDMSLFVFF